MGPLGVGEAGVLAEEYSQGGRVTGRGSSVEGRGRRESS